MSIASFFARSAWTSPWGVVDAAHKTPHRGFDIAHPGRTTVPALRGGRVVVRATSSILGSYFVIQVGSADFDGYCHQYTAAMPALGRNVSTGEDVSQLAGYSDLHGSAWTGPHLHLTNGPAAQSVYAGATRNPRPLIEAALAGFAQSGGATPITLGAEMPSLIRRTDGSIATVGDTTYQLHSSLATYTADSSAYGPYHQVSDADFAQAIANTQIRLAYLKAQLSGTPGSAVDPAAIAAKVEQNLADDFARLQTQIQALDTQIGELGVEGLDDVVRAAAKAGAGEALTGLTLVAK